MTPDQRQAGTEIPEHLSRSLDRDQLSRMIREVNDTGVSFQVMADRAAAAGHPLSRSQFQKLAANVVRTTPGKEEAHAIAAGLQRPLRLVQRAIAVQFLDYEATELGGYGDDVRVIVAHLAGMDEVDRQRWRAMIEADERVRAEARHESDCGDAWDET
ncbi:hypothetical protein C1I97_25200 [Streptomyces sp. NTH33]|uniref:hypothetical protein n=1 Tax=Streptomyces sp. NTH33 TaxID=1735453 RepID=UPI000DA71209|nr:hypothetical protein [Streptomyces sp. NTH33]PZG97835.1 hypothetical protein C1I97_25200 [Streptomyces sp. NTH33]